MGSYDPQGMARESMAWGLKQLVMIGLDEIDARVPRWHGNLKQSIRGAVDVPNEVAWIDSNSPYVDVQDYQLRWFRRTWWPNVQNIQDWVNSRFRASGDDLARLTYLISRKIAMHGVNPSMFMEAGFDAIEAMIPSVEEETGYEYAARMGI